MIDSRYEYELIVVPGLDLNDSVVPVIKTRVKEPPALINPVDLGGSTAAGKTFTMGVRLRTQQVRTISGLLLLNFLLFSRSSS